MPWGDVNGLSREATEALPTAVYMTDADGRLTFYNEAAVALWGCRPEVGQSKFCGSWKLYWPDGTPMPHDDCPMALALRQRRPIRGMEAVAERPDGTRIPFIPYPTPLFDKSGKLTGAVNMLVDISERKRIEAALAERQAQLAVFVEHAPAAIAMFDREMRYLAVSRRYILDFRLPQEAPLIGRSHYEVFPDIPQRWRDVHARVLAGEELSQAEDQFTRQDGCTHWVRWSMAPWRRADGSIGGALLFSEHRTEQVEARRALIDSEARFRGTFENAAVGVAMVGPDGSILRANNSFARMLGYSVEELNTKTFRDLTHPEDLATNLSVLNKTLVGEADSYSIETRYVRKDGDVVWASLTVGCVRNREGAVDYFVSVVQDITDRKLAEARLAERNEQLDLAGKIARIGSFTYDHATQKLQLSPGCAAVYGLPEGTREISREDWRVLVHPDDLERLDADTRRALANRETELVLEFRILRRGEVRWIESRVLVLYNEVGRELQRIGAQVDVTDRKRAELALAERDTQLQLASKTARVGSLAIDFHNGLVKLSPGCAAILGLPESTVEMSSDDARKLVYPEDLAPLELRREQALLRQQREFVAQFRIRRADDGEVRWIEARNLILYNQSGKPTQLIGVRIDFTDRKLAADMLAERNLQLELAGRVGRVGSYAYDVSAEKLQVSEGYVAVHGLLQGTTETTLSEWRARVHPEDLGRLESVHDQAVADKRGEYSVEYRIIRSDGALRWIERRCLIFYDADARPQRVVGVSIDITERKQAEKQREILNAELDHRVKNVLAIVGAIIFQTQSASATIEDFVSSVDRRIRSLGSIHELLSHARWHGVSLQEIVRRAFAPYTAGKYYESGPKVTLRPDAAQAMAMVLHELATNAAKYGALSNNTGRVSVRWYWLPNEILHRRLVVEWQETDGPPVSTPNASGYGTSIIRELLPYELGGTADLSFAPGGVQCRLEVPADWVRNLVGHNN
jgi:PAS domain S-box-containing protein